MPSAPTLYLTLKDIVFYVKKVGYCYWISCSNMAILSNQFFNSITRYPLPPC